MSPLPSDGFPPPSFPLLIFIIDKSAARAPCSKTHTFLWEPAFSKSKWGWGAIQPTSHLFFKSFLPLLVKKRQRVPWTATKALRDRQLTEGSSACAQKSDCHPGESIMPLISEASPLPSEVGSTQDGGGEVHNAPFSALPLKIKYSKTDNGICTLPLQSLRWGRAPFPPLFSFQVS